MMTQTYIIARGSSTCFIHREGVNSAVLDLADRPLLTSFGYRRDVNCGGRSNEQQDDAALNNGSGFFDDRISSWICERHKDNVDRSQRQKPLI